NEDGVWGDATSFSVFLTPAFYETSWFRAAVLLALCLALLAGHRARVRLLQKREQELAARVQEALAEIKVLNGLLPICASCKKIRDDGGYWNQIETYIAEHSDAEFSHSLCPECMPRLYPEYASRIAARADLEAAELTKKSSTK